MSKTHQVCMDLEKCVLRIQGRKVKFIAEHGLPEKARVFDTGEDHGSSSWQLSSSGSSNPTSMGQNQGSTYLGQGHTLGTAMS